MQRPDDRLYIVTRADLPVGFASAQCAHAAFQFARDRWEQTAPWMRDSQWLVIVTVPDEAHLEDLSARARLNGVGQVCWHEPDRDNELTAVALDPGKGARLLCANLPLLGRELAVT
jgi:peptidyl-tRNA hydrolase